MPPTPNNLNHSTQGNPMDFIESRMTSLARSFPTLRFAAGVEPFDADALDAWVSGPAGTSGIRHAAAFVVNIWNRHHAWKLGWFDLISALGVLDDDHRNAIQAWMDDPWWP